LFHEQRSTEPSAPCAISPTCEHGALRVAMIGPAGGEEFVDEEAGASEAQPDSITVEQSNKMESESAWNAER
jgi:hypothetical protein